MRFGGSMVVGLMLIIIAASAAFAVPTTVNYQGYLTDDIGVPISGTVSITFRIYDAPTGGTLKWNETQDVDVSNGVYSVQLGAGGSPLGESVFTGEARYLEVEIGGTPLSPRLPFTSNAYAVRAGIANSVADGAVGTIKVADGAITAAKLATDSVGIGQIADNAVGTSELATGSVTSAKVSVPLSLSGSDTGGIVSGTDSGSGIGVYGESGSGIGVYGTSDNIGVKGESAVSTGTGVFGTGGAYGVSGIASIVNGIGVYGFASGDNGKGVYGINTSGGHAGYFEGDVAADDYQYRSSKTYYLNIPPTAFVKHPDSAGDPWSSLGPYAYISGAASPYSVQVDAPVYLPEGANVTQLRCYYKDSDTTYNVQMIVWLRASNPSTEALDTVTSLSVTSSGSSTSATYVNNTSYISSPTIDNASNQYYLHMQWQPETSGNSLQFWGCRIEYTMDTVAP